MKVRYTGSLVFNGHCLPGDACTLPCHASQYRIHGGSIHLSLCPSCSHSPGPKLKRNPFSIPPSYSWSSNPPPFRFCGGAVPASPQGSLSQTQLCPQHSSGPLGDLHKLCISFIRLIGLPRDRSAIAKIHNRATGSPFAENVPEFASDPKCLVLFRWLISAPFFR